MIRKKISSVLALIGCLTAAAAIVLEALPDSAVLVFGTGKAGVFEKNIPISIRFRSAMPTYGPC